MNQIELALRDLLERAAPPGVTASYPRIVEGARRRRRHRLMLTAATTAVVVVGGGIGTALAVTARGPGSGQTLQIGGSPTPSSSPVPSSPAPKRSAAGPTAGPMVLHAHRLRMNPASDGGAAAKPGAAVPATAVDHRVRLNGSTIAGLADTGSFFGTSYAALSRDNGGTWVIDSPQFSRAAADGPGVTDALSHTDGGLLVAWGYGGNFIKITDDQGTTWYQTDFPEGIHRVTAQGRELVARETQATHQGRRLPDLTYYSKDGGHTWRLIPAGSVTGPSSPPDCATSSLHVTVEPYGGGAGHFYQRLQFRNTSRQPCTLYGYPGVSYTDSNGRQVGFPAQRVHLPRGPVEPVVILPGDSAHALLDIPDYNNYSLPGHLPTRPDGRHADLPAEPANRRTAALVRSDLHNPTRRHRHRTRPARALDSDASGESAPRLSIE